jgi:hypothetical protein
MRTFFLHRQEPMMAANRIGLVAVVIFGAFGAQSQAAVTLFSDRASWASATGTYSTVGFENLAPTNFYSYQGTATVIEGVTFQSSSGMYVIGGAYAESGGLFSTGTGSVLFGYTVGINASGIGTVKSFGVDLRGYQEATTPFAITLSNGQSFNVTITNPTGGGAGGGFFGVTTDTPFTSVVIDSGTSYSIIDNVSYGALSATADVPEPASLAIWGLSALGCAIRAFRGRRRT